MNKKAQLQISFGMIFSVILIIVFIAFAIYGIWKFLEGFRESQVLDFKKSLQEDIDWVWMDGGAYFSNHSLPNSIEQVCFVNDEIENFYFVPDKFNGGVLEHVDFSKTIPENSEELCIDTNKREISLYIKKDSGGLVVIE